jgi:hypothetical protein
VIGARGEGQLGLDGETYVILFTNRAIADAERATGKTVMKLMRGFASDDIGMSDVAILLMVGLQYARREHRSRAGANDTQDAWTLLNKLGFAAVASVVFTALTEVMSYRQNQENGDPPA